jgi:polyferredoxin
MAAVVAVVAIALLTLAFGRIYCSTLCPLGTLQDVVIRLSTTRRRRRRFRFAPPVTAVHLGIAAIALGTALSAQLVLLDLLEP